MSDPSTGTITVEITPSATTQFPGLARELASVILYRIQAQCDLETIQDRAVGVARPEGLEFIIGGVARAVAAEIEAPAGVASASADQACRQIGLETEWRLPVYELMVGGPAHAPTPESYWNIAESFGAYLLRRDGPRELAEFLHETNGGDISYAASVAYGKYIEGLSTEWIDFQLRLGSGRKPVAWHQFLRRALPYFRPYPWLAALCIALVFATSILAQYAPFATRDILDTPALREVPPEPFGNLSAPLKPLVGAIGWDTDDTAMLKWTRVIRLVLTLFAVNVLQLGTQVLLIYYVNVLGQNVLRDLRLRFVDRINGLSASQFGRSSTGDLQARFLSDLVRLADPMTQIVSYSMYHLIFLIAVVVAMFQLAWQLTLVLIFCIPLYVSIAAWLGPKLQAAIRARQERLAVLNADLKQMVDAHPLIQIGNLQHFLRRRAEPAIEHSRKVEIKSDFYTGMFSETVGITNQFFNKAVFFTGATLMIFGGMTAGTVTAFVLQSSRGIARLQSLMNIYRHIAVAAAALQRVEEVLKYEVESLGSSAAAKRTASATPARLSKGIEFDNVSFSYNGVDKILRNISLSIPVGSKVAFVGPTGAGKTTVVNMIPRFYDPTEGTVRIDGQDTMTIPLPELRARVGLVSQDTFLFNMTIRENIGLGRLDATDEEVVLAAKKARIHDHIMSLPAGYHTLVGERGSRLSGGQRQRIAVARAILRNPTILILDEATSALDAETEREILDELDEVTRGITTVSITHRFALAMRADRIYVVEHGEIIEEGTHDELMARGGLYRRLFDEQNQLILTNAIAGAAAVGKQPVLAGSGDQERDTPS